MRRMVHICSMIACLGLMAFACTQQPSPQPDKTQPSGSPLSLLWDFDSDADWVFTASSGDLSCNVENGSIYLYSRANRKDISSIETLRNDFLSGEYEWRLYVPNFQSGEQIAFTCGLRLADASALTFGISYGTQELRSDFGLAADELMLCLSSSSGPYSASYCAVSPGWHNLKIKLSEDALSYKAAWLLDGEEKFSISLDYGPEQRGFSLFCSLGYEQGSGTKVPEQDYQVRIDYVSADAYVSGSYIEGANPVSLSFGISGNVPLSDGLEFSLFSKGGNYRFVSRNSEISGSAPEDASYWALFPYDSAASISKTGISTSIPSEVKAFESLEAAQCLSVAETESDSFYFYDLMSRMQLCLDESLADVSEIIISDPSGRALEGSLTIDCDSFDLYTKALSDACIHLKPADVSAFKTDVPYFFSILSGRYAQGLELRFMSGGSLKGSISLPAMELKAGECSDMQQLSIEQQWKETRWEFNSNINGWYYYTHNPASGECYSLEDGCLKLWTNANSMDRNKLHTIREDFGEGIYTFRTYVSRIAAGEKCSIGAFIYSDDAHEMDFEIGYGKAAARQACGAADDEMVACMTSQDLPFNSTYTPISVGWHTLVLKLDVIDGKYRMTWIIDDVQIKQLNLRYGPEIKFLISVSVENLEFMGDFQPVHENYALFDYVSYKQQLQ